MESSLVDDEEFSLDELPNVDSVWGDESCGALDELSAIEPILEEYYDRRKTLSKEDAARINNVIENYLHSAANRELIAENDA